MARPNMETAVQQLYAAILAAVHVLEQEPGIDRNLIANALLTCFWQVYDLSQQEAGD